MVLNLFRKKAEPSPESVIPVEPAAVTPAQLTRTERETQGGTRQAEPLDFADSRSTPAPRAATARRTTVPAQVGAAQQLRSLRKSNALRQRRTGRPSAVSRTKRPVRAAKVSKARPAKRSPARRTAARKAR